MLDRHGLSLPTHALALPAFAGLGIVPPGDWIVLSDGDNQFSSADLSGKRRPVEESELSGSQVEFSPASESTNKSRHRRWPEPLPPDGDIPVNPISAGADLVWMEMCGGSCASRKRLSVWHRTDSSCTGSGSRGIGPGAGRRCVSRELRELIFRMVAENPSLIAISAHWGGIVVS